VKLIDFASFYASKGDLKTSSNELIGTPQYLAPELWQGEQRSSHSDLFALGLIEIDLKQGLQNLPSLPEDCRARAEQAADSDTHFFYRNPLMRCYKKIQRNIISKKNLGRQVSQILKERLMKDQRTQILRSENQTLRKSQIALLCALAVLCFVVPGTTSETATPKILNAMHPAHSKKALLEIRTSQWIEVLLDGKNYGFAPIVIDQMNPGIHSMKWNSAKARGEFKFKLESGEWRVLCESDFLGLAKKQKKSSERRFAGNTPIEDFKSPVLMR
jgi:serine/threonine protein kinase